MADYDATVGVQLQDDFSSLLSGLKSIENTVRNLQNQINHLLVSSNQLKSVFNGLSKTNLSDTLNTAKTSLAANANKMQSQYSSLAAKIKSASVDTSTGNTMNRFVGLNDINGTKLKQIIEYQQHISGLGKSLDQLGTKSEKNSIRFWRFFDLNKLYFYLNYFKQAFRGIGNIIESALNFTETENYFARAMGNMYDDAMKFQNKLSDMFGTAMSTTMNAQAVYKNMIGNLGGIAEDLSYRLSEIVTKMTLDFSSLYNVDFESTSKKFQSALSKQVRPIRSVSGFDITQNVLQQTADSIGMSKIVSAASELEKRLLVILTLMDQMRRSGAMNDFSRTIEQPANQLRVLKEQIVEVGRWLGSVFYGILGQILPYINGFVMAIKEVVKWLAMLVGYEIPNSSGETGTILDSYGDVDAIEDVNDSIGETGSAIDDANKKAKEFQKTTAGFDKLNIIKKPTETSSSGGGGGGGASLGGSIDPAILNALDKYKYLFDNVHMKAMEIRDAILAWGDAVRKSINENIFEPLKKSWDKYGSSILLQFSDGFGKLKLLAMDFIDTWSANWKPNFQAVSDLFMSLLDTGSMVFDIIADAMLSVWEKGGKTLFIRLQELARAFITLATAINDNFVKPLLKWFKNSISPIMSDVLGTFMSLLGNVISILANFVNGIAKSKSAIVLLTSVATSFFAVMKVAKFVELVNVVGKANSTLKVTSSVASNVLTVLYDNNKVVRTLTNAWIEGENKVSIFKRTYGALNGVLSNTRIWTSISDSIKNVAGKLTSFGTTATESGNILGKAVSGMGSALSWLAANPVVAVVAGLAALTAGIIVFSNTHQSETDKVKVDLEKLDTKLDETGKKVNDLSDRTKEALSSAGDDYIIHTKYLEKLVNMTGGKDGYVENIEQAKRMVERLNLVSADCVSITEEGYVIWKKTPAEIEKAIAGQKRLLELEVLEEQYKEARKEEKEIRQALVDATKTQSEAQQVFNDKMAELQRQNPGESYNQLAIRAGEAKTNFDKANGSLAEATFQLAKNTRQQEEWALKEQEAKYEQLGTIDALIESAVAHASLATAMDKTAGKNGELTASYDSLVASLKGYDQQIADHTNGVKTMSQEEMKQTLIAKDFVIQSLVEKAAAHKQTYDEMLVEVKKCGIELSEEEKKQLETSYNNYTSGNATQESIQAAHYAQLKQLFAQQGIEMTEEQIRQIEEQYANINGANEKIRLEEANQHQKLLDLLKTHYININSEEGKAYVERLEDAQKNGLEAGKSYLEQTEKGFEDMTPEVTAVADGLGKVMKGAIESNKANVQVDTSDAETKVDDLQKKAGFTKTANIDVNFSSKQKGISFGSSLARFEFFAEGGFPKAGELFMARENGINEMVGRMGGRSAVANNDQIVDGIEAGVFNAVIRALQLLNVNGNNQPIYNETIVKIGEEIITKQLSKANEKRILRTGKPLFSTE